MKYVFHTQILLRFVLTQNLKITNLHDKTFVPSEILQGAVAATGLAACAASAVRRGPVRGRKGAKGPSMVGNVNAESEYLGAHNNYKVIWKIHGEYQLEEMVMMQLIYLGFFGV